MKKILSTLVLAVVFFTTVLPSADAAVRVRRDRVALANAVYVPYYQAPQIYQPNQSYYPNTNSNTNTYYFSPNYIQGYTYYSTPTPGYYLYNSNAVNTYNTISEGKYYFSPNYVPGYTYYSTPTSGYYYYLGTTTVSQNYNYNNGNYNYNYNNQSTFPYNNGNTFCTIINGVYQCSQNVYGSDFARYPGCTSADIVIGGQIWASCNALDRNQGSTKKTGWFFAGDRESSFVSINGSNTALEWIGKQTRESSWNVGPCATGYRLPTRGEWETLNSYARAGNTTISRLIGLGLNGSYQGTRNTNGDIVITGRLSASAAYWTSSVDGGAPMVMHVGSTYAGYNTTGTDYGYVNNGYQWTYTDSGLELIRATTGELANVRCIRN